ncbi:MAG TPA: CAP domain-containing protein [Methylomirabilota bacterium]|nr:CAP domain-containing protein [Methylomirabilota bacterium]
MLCGILVSGAGPVTTCHHSVDAARTQFHHGRVLLRAIPGALLLALLAAALVSASPTPEERRLFQLLNRERGRLGVPELQWDDHLAQSARAHAQRLADHRSLSHQFPGEPELMVRIGATGMRFDYAAENIGRANTVETVHADLMDSPPHRANILSERYDSVGIGIIASNGTLWVAENFAHALPDYSEAQFRDALLAAFNRVREGRNLPAIDAHLDDKLRRVACSGEANARRVIETLSGATELAVFTTSVPQELPSRMSAAALEPRYRRMDIGVCFRPGPVQGYGSFSVAAAFFP